jgi:type I restriction enzyme S subunit
VSWERVPLNDLCETIDYGVTASANAQQGKAKFLRITDIQNNTVNWETVPFCDAPDRKLANAALRDGDIVFARTGATTGKSFLLKKPPQSAVFASYLIRVRPSKNVDPGFLAHFFDTNDYWRQIKSKSQGAAQEGVNASKLATLQIPLPPLDEQKRIAANLDKADQLRQKRRQAIALLDSLTQSIFLEMFGDLRINPNHYPIVAVGDVTDCIVPGRDKPKSFTGTVPWITTGELNSMGYTSSINAKQSLSQEEISEVRARVIPRESVILTCVGDLGIVSIANEPMVINQQLHSYQCSSSIEPEFLMHALTFKKDYMFARATKTTLPYMNKSVCNSIPIPLPPIESQKHFRSVLRETKARSEAMLTASIHADDLFASLQHRAFTGQL